MFRRARAWASDELARLLRAEMVGARADLETSLDTSMQTRVAQLNERVDRETSAREATLAVSLDRVATALDAIAEQLAADARDHRASLAAVEFVVREMALAFVRPVDVPSTVVGGTIDGHIVDAHAVDFALDAHAVDVAHDRDPELGPGCVVEVRSRFQQRWVEGFEIVEVVEHEAGTRYRLARHADHVHLPALFEASDLRPRDVVTEIVIDPDDPDDHAARGAAAAISRDAISSVPDDPGSRR